MKIAVCIKAVPDPAYYDQITLDPVRKTLNRAGIPAVTNEADLHALEAALVLKNERGGCVDVFTMAPPSATEQLRECLALGADHAYLLSDRRVGGADTLATSYTLAQLLKTSGQYDLILCGNDTPDGATGHVPTQIGTWLGIAHAMNVIGLQVLDDHTVRVKRQFEDGIGTYDLTMPCVAAVTSSVNKVRYTTAAGISRAVKKEITVYSADDIDLDQWFIGLSGSPTQSGDLKTIELSRAGKILGGSAAEAAQELAKQIRQHMD